MAQCKLTAEEFVQDTFSPLVAVLCSSDVESICLKNNLSFVELVQPFCRLSSEAVIRDANNVSYPIHNLHVVIHDMNNVQPPSTLLSQKLLTDVVSNALPASTSSADILPSAVVTVGNHDLQLSVTTPWFEAYRESFLRMAYPSDHEFLRHFLACMFVVSSSHPDPMEEFVKLTQLQHTQQHQQPHKLPKWFTPNILRYYVLVHDVSEQVESKAEAVYQLMKTRFGVQACHLLHINSYSPSAADSTGSEQEMLPNPWSRYVTRKLDIDESSEFESSYLLPEESNGGFPGHVSEGKLGGSQVSIDLDTAIEAVEDSRFGSMSVIDHPLAPLGRSASLDVLSSTEGLVVTSTHSSMTNLAAVVNSAPLIESTASLGTCTANSIGSVALTKSLTAEADGLRQPTTAAKLGAMLTLSDHERLRVFIQEFVTHGLIPWAEKTIRALNEQVVTRKGIHRSFLSATKKWFSGNKPVNPAVITSNTNVVYTAEAPEMQMRRLADLAFMFQMYELAYQIYHAVKKDFNNDHAWLYFAGATEMACLAVFMQSANSQRPYPFHYMETAITTYLAACKVPHFATRATLLSTEVLKSKGLYQEAASQLIKMTSEESDLRSALLLEQAAHCYIKMKVPWVRKYAFHMILAGHRFNKAWQKRHALRAYAQALQVYKGRNWSLAEDHINFTIGCQSFNLKLMDVATAAFKHLLSINSKQSVSQQTAFLREYLTVFKQLNIQSCESSLPQLPLPIIESSSIKVLCGRLPAVSEDTGARVVASGVSFDATDAENETFVKLEKEIVSASGESSVNFKPTVDCFTSETNNTSCPVVAAGETLTVELVVTNPLKVVLVLRDLTLLWQFVAADDQSNKPSSIISNEAEFCSSDKSSGGIIECHPIPEVHLEGAERKLLHLTLTVNVPGELQISSLAFRLSSAQPAVSLAAGSQPQAATSTGTSSSPVSVAGFVNLEVQGTRLNNTKDERMGKVYAPDRRLNVIITAPLPKLEVYFCQFPSQLLFGEVREVAVELVNVGTHPLQNVKVASKNPDLLAFDSKRTSSPSTTSSNGSDSTPSPNTIYPLLNDRSSSNSFDTVTGSSSENGVFRVPLLDNRIEPGQTVRIPMWIRGPDASGEHALNFLFYYQPVGKDQHINVDTPVEQRSLNSVVVSVEVENVNTVQDAAQSEFSVLQVSCISRNWKLQKLDTLQQQELKEGEYIVTNVPLGAVKLDAARSVATNFCCRRRGGVDVLSSDSAANSCDDGLDDSHKIDMTLVVIWKASVVAENGDTSTCFGQLALSIARLGTLVSCPKIVQPPVELPPVKIVTTTSSSGDSSKLNAELASQLLSYKLHHPPSIQHDFNINRLCTVTVSLELLNCTRSALTVDVNTWPSHERRLSSVEPVGSRTHSFNDVVYHDRPSQEFTWVGPTITRVQLTPNEAHLVTLTACFVSSGIYDLSRLQISASDKLHTGDSSRSDLSADLNMMSQHGLSASLIVVTHSADSSGPI